MSKSMARGVFSATCSRLNFFVIRAMESRLTMLEQIVRALVQQEGRQ